MKKTIIALLALAGVATAETVVFDFGRIDDDAYKTSNAIVIGTGKSAYRTDMTSSGDLGAITGLYTYEQAASTGYYANSATLTTAEENGWKNHLTSMPDGWESSFADGLTSQWDGTSGNKHVLTLTNLAAGYYNFSILGGYNGKDILTSSITLSISGNKVDTTNATWISYDIAGGTSYSTQNVATYTTTLTNGTTNEGYTYDVSKIFVEEGGSLTLTLTGDTTIGSRTPLNGIKVTYSTPEPATATLSLLALAGLAVRRRRK